MSKLPPSPSPIPPATHDHKHDRFAGVNRRERRRRHRHRPIFTSTNVLQDKSSLNSLGLEIVARRIAKRRGKNQKWTEKKAKSFVKKNRLMAELWAKAMQELYGVKDGSGKGTEGTD